MSETHLEVDGLERRFGDLEVLAGVSFSAAGGDALAVVGPSGCGKSTLLHILGTLDRPSAGHLSLDGVDPFDLDGDGLARFRNQRIGFVFQDHQLLPQYDVLENVLIPAAAFPGDLAAARDHARKLLAAVGLGERLDHRPARLSGGEQQRVAVARALINDPDLLLCDEPTGNLDPAIAGTVADLLFELHARRQGVMIVVTHSRDLAVRFPRRLVYADRRFVEESA